MKINLKNPYFLNLDICQLIDEDSKRNIVHIARKELQEYWTLTIEDVDILLYKSLHYKKKHFDLPEHISVLQHFWYVGFLEFFAREFITTLDALRVPSSLIKPYERQAQRHLIKTTLIENLLILARNYFGHSSFERASKTQLAELLLAIKDKTNNDIFQRVATDLQIKQMKHHN